MLRGVHRLSANPSFQRWQQRRPLCFLTHDDMRIAVHRIPRSISSSEKNHGLRFEGIFKIDLQEIALQRPKTGKFDYLSGPNPVFSATASRPRNAKA